MVSQESSGSDYIFYDFLQSIATIKKFFVSCLCFLTHPKNDKLGNLIDLDNFLTQAKVKLD